MKLGRAFGTGMGQGSVCGAVSGALMILGLAQGGVVGNDRPARLEVYEKARGFARRFEAGRRTTICRELIGYDLATSEGYAAAAAADIFNTVCLELVRFAAEILEELL